MSSVLSDRMFVDSVLASVRAGGWGLGDGGWGEGWPCRWWGWCLDCLLERPPDASSFPQICSSEFLGFQFEGNRVLGFGFYI